MSDVYCGQCGKYHASLTACPNQNLQAVYTQKGTTTIDLDEMRAEIVKLRAREAKLREALVRIVALADLGDCITSFRRAENAMDIARAALGEGKP
ncbi:MAG: hypothetical protein WC481_07705 [Candidatus Omnitrophota bacterium]